MRYIAGLVTLTLLSAACPTIVYAEDEGDYVEIDKGEKAPFTGFLFDNAGIAAQIARHDAEKAKLKLALETECSKVKIDLQSIIDKKEAEININKQASEDLLKLNKAEIDRLSAKLERSGWVTPTMFVGGVLAGAMLTISVLKVAITITK